jgi:hypothetical protein
MALIDAHVKSKHRVAVTTDTIANFVKKSVRHS